MKSLQWPIKDALTGRRLKRGTEATLTRAGGRWAATAEEVDWREFDRLMELQALLKAGDQRSMEPEDYELLDSYARRFRHFGQSVRVTA